MNRPIALLSATVLLLMTPALTGSAIADSHTPGNEYTAPAPTKIDRAGTDQDEYCIPHSYWTPTTPYTTYRVNARYVEEGMCHPTNGAAQVTITGDENSMVETGDATYGSWTFDYSTDPGPAAAPDVFAVSVGQCMTNPAGVDDAHRLVSVSMTNTADAGGRYIPELWVGAFLGREQINTFSGKTSVARLEDGQSATIDLFARNVDGSPDIFSGMEGGENWTIKVFRVDGGRSYPVSTQDFHPLPSCRMTRVRRGYSKTDLTITAHDYWGAPTNRSFRIRLLDKRGRTVYKQAVPMTTGTTRTVVLKKSAIPHRILAKGMPEIVVEQYDSNSTYDISGDGLPPTHWGADYGGAGYDIPAWKTRRR